MPLKVRSDTGTLTLKWDEKFGAQLYYPIISLREGSLKLSFRTCFVLSWKTWQWDWAGGFEILGFGFGFCKYKD